MEAAAGSAWSGGFRPSCSIPARNTGRTSRTRAGPSPASPRTFCSRDNEAMIWAVFHLLLQAGRAVSQPAAPEVLGDYPLGPRDVIEVHVSEITELNVERRV